MANVRTQITACVAMATLLLMFAASSAPTPLYHLYEINWRLSPLTLTAIFAVYTAGFLAALLTVGSLSDFVGRRPVACASLVLEIAAMAILATAGGPLTLMAARVLQGVATGAAASTLGASIIDTSRNRGALINSITPLLGTAAGAIFSSVMLGVSTAPERLVFVLFGGVFTFFAVAVWGMQETARRAPGALGSLRPQIVVPLHVRSVLRSVTPVNWAVWALAGFYLALMPSLLRLTTGSNHALLGGVAVAALTVSGASGILLLHRLSASRIFTIGTTTLTLGVAVTLVGVAWRSLPLLMLGTVVAGSGFGAGYFGGLRTVLPLADPSDRAALLSAIYVQCYLAFSLPTLAVGLLIPSIGLITATYVYGSVLIALGARSLLLGNSRK